ncbi:MAG: hypothetical protein M3N50_09355 [Pseudomonadota bacterium]|nr:hypothetical protein [Pseudomonadota bacterium]
MVSAGAALHLPMFWMARSTGFNMSGMSMNQSMLIGMLMIVFGILAAGYGFLPIRRHEVNTLPHFAPPEEAILSSAHWKLMGVLAVALIIDIMKPAGLGFVTPGMRTEYGVDRATVALLPLSALLGTAAGSFVWGSVAASAYLYSVWSTRSSLVLAIAITTMGLVAVLLRGSGLLPSLASPVMPVSLLIVGSSAMISILLPYAAESYPIKVRGRATGWVAGWSKIGGLCAQALSALALVPALAIAAALIAVPAAVSMALIGFFGRETRGRDLRDLESAAASQAAATMPRT